MTANMTNRDAKGKFVKAPFKVGDKVRAGSQPEIGTITEFLNCGRECRVQFDPPWNSYREVTQTLRKADELQPAPAPCPFKVGDRVETNAVNDAGPGEVTEVVNGGADCKVKFNSWYGTCTESIESLRKVEDAPAKEPLPPHVVTSLQSKANAWDAISQVLTSYYPKWKHGTGSLKDRACGHLRDQADHFDNMEHSAQATMDENARLKAELAEAKRDADSTQSDWEDAHQLLDGANVAMGTKDMGVHLLERIAALVAERDTERKTREGKAIQLEDLAAIVKCMELAKASPVDDWDFTTLTRDVLNRGEAA